MGKKLGIVIYANPDYYPPVINAIKILAREFDLLVFSRNHDKPQIEYADNVQLYRFGKLKTAQEKEAQGLVVKVLEYIVFSAWVIFYTYLYGCRIIYTYDEHGFISGFLARCFGRAKILIYHNLDLSELEKTKGLSRIIKYGELYFARYADKIIFADLHRAKYFKKETELSKLPDIAMNTPLRLIHLPPNKLKEALKVNGFSEDIKAVLYQGAINEAHSLIEIVQSMVLWPKDAILVLIGNISRDFLGNIYNIAQSLDIGKRLCYIPAVPYPEIFSYTRGAYIGLALYKTIDINQMFNAGASNKIFEYISLGIPVVTNDSPYFREVLDSSLSYFTKPDSVEDIAKTINLAFSDTEEYCRKSQAARQAHLTNLNYEEQFKPILEYIR